MWIKVPINRSDLIPEAADLGFAFHHAEKDSSMLCQWLDQQKSNKLPRFATHQVGVAGKSDKAVYVLWALKLRQST